MVTRRDVLVAGASATALAATRAPVQAQSAQKTFVLVHGSWAGGWVWRYVSDLLESRGHKVFAPTLTGVGERSHLLNDNVGLNTHITDIVNVIKWERLDDFVLVGHSYGGNVITGVAEQFASAIRAIIFLDAFVPDPGPQQQAQFILDEIAKGAKMINPPPIAVFENGNKSNAWLEPLLMPMPISAYTDSVAASGGRERIKKKIFVRTTRYRVPAFEASYTKVRSNPAWVTIELDCGHHGMVEMPDKVAQILLDAA